MNGEKPDVIPCYGECPMDVTVSRDLAPKRTGDPVRDGIAVAECFGNSAVGAWVGVMKQETISRDESHHTYRFESGAVWHEHYQPTFYREATVFPISTPEEALRYEMPEVNDPAWFDDEDLRRQVQLFHAAGYFVESGVMGAWEGIYDCLTRFDNILMWMAAEPGAAHALFDKARTFSLDAAKRLLACGVDCIITASDLGSGGALLFSPAMFREYVFPWLSELAELCHAQRAYLHLHSHGHIEDVMDGIVEAGVDIINPVGPSDRNDLAMFKRRWGDKITLHGGISTTINTMSEEELRRHVSDVISVGRMGGRFFPRTESGIPPMPPEKGRFYVETLREQCRRGYE